ncbi:hypothetical protein WS54_15750 [Burkholderia sp. NRF60-BP8]|nr:hypothetical protein WS54_15750 [Burkholderia sp. NRF60-BP8]KVA17836.1 hypothetical protein WS54_04425 [Burkholderia sp. NRF60-BP8]
MPLLGLSLDWLLVTKRDLTRAKRLVVNGGQLLSPVVLMFEMRCNWRHGFIDSTTLIQSTC